MAYKIARSGAEGNMRLLAKYGGGSKPPRQAYATGGAVKGENPSLAEGMAAAPAAKLSGGGKKAPGKSSKGAKKARTNVNVIIMGKGDAPKGDAPPPDMPPMAGPMPPPGPGGPPMMRKTGGRIPAFAKGGAVKRKADGGEVDDNPIASHLRGSSRAKKNSAGVSNALAGVTGALTAIEPSVVGKGVGAGVTGMLLKGASDARKDAKELKRGAKMWENTGMPGRPSSSDPDENSTMRKSGGRICKSVGGPASPPKGFDAGAGGGRGRLEKARKYGK